MGGRIDASFPSPVATRRVRVAVLISGNGSNCQALIDAAKDPAYPAEIVLVISNRPDAYGLTRARASGVATHILDNTAFPSRTAFDAALHEVLQTHRIDLICLAGFMRLLTPDFVAQWPQRILNIHPSLLPAFKGLHPQRQALAAGVAVSGCTVHYVVAEVDAGPTLLQAEVPILKDDSEDSLSARILKEEHRLYPMALRQVACDLTKNLTV